MATTVERKPNMTDSVDRVTEVRSLSYPSVQAADPGIGGDRHARIDAAIPSA